MAKNYSQRKITRKSVIAALCALSVTCTGLAAACTPNNNKDDPDPVAREDTQLLKNGNFEFFNVPKKGVYLINNVNDWTLGGDSSVKSGIIGTSDAAWEKLTDAKLADKLDYNNDLGLSSEDYVDYNSMRSRDILYKDPYAATLEADKVADDKYINNQGAENYFGIVDGKIGNKPVYKDEDTGVYYFDQEHTQEVRFEQIKNPGTHLNIQKDDNGYYYMDGNEKVTVYSDDDGYLFLDEDKKESVGNVLMVHNYATDGKYNGIHQYYSSNTITLEANTAAEISVWVKTSDIKFDKGYVALDEQDKGAFIEVVQTVNSSTVDSFVIKNINTEKIIKYAENENPKVEITAESNGWLQYTVYVNSCDFASSTIQLRLGLGQNEGAEKCTGYAFFDDVSVTKYRDLESEGCTYKDSADKNLLENTTCSLTSEKDDKIFNADKELREGQGNRHNYNFHYLVDLASERTLSDANANTYSPITFGNNVTAKLTSEKDGNKYYASAESLGGANVTGNVIKSNETYSLVKNFEARPTDNDLIGAFDGKTAFTSSLFNGKDYSKLLNDGLIGEGNDISVLPKYGVNSNMLVTLSAWGAAYTSTIADNSFTVDGNGYKIVSFWIKTSDMGGKPAATAKIYQVDSNGKEIEKTASQSLKVESTNITSDFEDEKDIYNGWVQCFFFIENTTDEQAKFHVDFSFGNTTIKDATSYNGGWAAIANMQTLEIDEEVYKLATSGDRCALFSVTATEDDESGNKMDEATGTSDIKTGISVPANYNGINGGNSTVTDAESRPSYDANNTNGLAGLINKEYAVNYDNWDVISKSFGKANASWEEVFGADCYQPLIIINNIRIYAEKASATEDTYKNYLIEAADGDIVINGKTYKSAENTEWDENATYYSRPVSNYGFAAGSKTVSANSYQAVSVKVKVSGDAKAYIYLVDADSPKNILNYTTPAYTFYYDEEGNVLDEKFDKDWKESEHRSHIVYKYDDENGLYKNYRDEKDETNYANLYNLVKNYRNYKFEHNVFYDKNGKEVSFDDLVNGEDYYASATDHGKFADHYLTNTDGTRVFEYLDGKYYYLEEGKRTVEVEGFDKSIVRYDYTALNEELSVEVGNTDDEWKTVHFIIKTGSEAKKYRLELWNGKRDDAGKIENLDDGAVAFDYVSYPITSSNYANVIGEYEKNIIDAYKAKVLEKYHNLDKISSNAENISYFEETLVKDGVLTETEVNAVKAQFNYNAKYYTYTLYDSESYVPFNPGTAKDGATGYDYNAGDFGETLAYFEYENKNDNSYNVFADYSAVDQSISLNNGTDDGDDGEEDKDTESGDIWLYVSSIILVVILLITLISLLTRMLVKKYYKKSADDKKSKNVYRQRDRYIKKLHLVKNEEEISGDGADSETETTSQPEEVTETVENAEVENQQPAETVEETEVVETEVTEEVTEETPSEDNGEDK